MLRKKIAPLQTHVSFSAIFLFSSITLAFPWASLGTHVVRQTNESYLELRTKQRAFNSPTQDDTRPREIVSNFVF